MRDEMNDTGVFVGYRTGRQQYHVLLSPLETRRFGFGLELADFFEDASEAEAWRLVVQDYVDSWKAHVVADAVRHHENPYMKRADNPEGVRIGEGWAILSGIGERMVVLETEEMCDRVMQDLTGEAGPFEAGKYYGRDLHKTEDEEEEEKE